MAKILLMTRRSMIFLPTFIRCDGRAPADQLLGREALARRKDAEEGFLMAYVAIADRDTHFMTADLHHEVHLESGSQSHRNPVRDHRHWIGLVASHVGVDALQLGSPFLLHHRPNNYYQFITMHGMIMVIYLLTRCFSGVWQLPHSADVRRADMVFPYMNMVSYWYIWSPCWCWCAFFVPGDPPGRVDLVPRRLFFRYSGSDLGHHFDAAVARHIHRRIHHGRIELCDDCLQAAVAG